MACRARQKQESTRSGGSTWPQPGLGLARLPARALHTCDRPSCCNPDHLYEGTTKDNYRDALERNPQTRIHRIKLIELLRTPERRERARELARVWPSDPSNLEYCRAAGLNGARKRYGYDKAS